MKVEEYNELQQHISDDVRDVNFLRLSEGIYVIKRKKTLPSSIEDQMISGSSIKNNVHQ